MNYTALKTELTSDPLTRGYAAMTSQQAADSLNTANRPVERSVVPAHEVFEAVVPSEWAALAAAEKTRFQSIIGMGDVNLKGTNTRAALAAMFAAGTTTRANLIALQAGQPISRAAELGLGEVTAGDIERARVWQ